MLRSLQLSRSLKKASVRLNRTPRPKHSALSLLQRYRFSSQKGENEFDLCIIGCGGGGFAAAIRGWDYGKKVAVISPNLGGTTIHNGALSSKVMWQLSRQCRHIRNAFSDYKPSFDEMRNRVAESTSVKVRHYSKQLSDLSADAPVVRYSPKEDGGGGEITLFDGYASFTSPHTVCIAPTPFSGTDNSAPRRGARTIKSDYFLIATGSKPRTSQLFSEVPQEHLLSSDDLLTKLDRFPKSLLIYGGGVIGCEFATIFSNFGMCDEIHLFNERRTRLLPHEDPDLSQFLAMNFEAAQDINLLNSVKLTRAHFDPSIGKVRVEFDTLAPKDPSNPVMKTEQDYNVLPGGARHLDVDAVLLAIGRDPNLSNLNLDAAMIDFDRKGRVISDEHLRLQGRYGNVFACGDALGKWGLVSVAEMEARHAVEVMFAQKNPLTKVDYNHISSVIFGRPEIACVGLNEQMARERKIAYKSGLLRLGLVNRAVIDWNERHYGPIEPKKAGFIKLIATDDDDKQLIGMRAVGAGASTVIQTASLLIRNGASIRELDRVAHPHPAITEGVQECARMLLGRSTYKPHIWPRSHVTHWSPQHGTSFHAADVGPKRYQQLVPGYMG